MKITILALHLGYGGVEKFITNTANMLVEDNEVEIISTYRIFEKPVFDLNPKIKITYLLENLKPNQKEFFESIKKFKIISFVKQSFIALKILYLKKSKMKRAVKEIESDIVISTRPMHNKILSKYGKSSIRKIATEHNYNGNKNSYIKKVVNSCKNIDCLVIASKQLCEIYSKKMTKCKCKVINIPLSLDSVPNETVDLEKKEITYIGRLSKEKGILDLIDVFRIIHNQDKDVILNLIGEGKEEKTIKKRIQKYKLENNVILHGYKNKDGIEKILLNTAIGINTSYTESFGLAVLETMSYGIPCIAFSTAEGLKEIIKNDINGYLIEKRNFEEMAGKALELIKNKEKRLELSKNAQGTTKAYTQEEIKKSWLNILKE